MKKTGWYKGTQKPVRRGWYEREVFHGSIRRHWWCRGRWYMDKRGWASFYQELPWRGRVK